MLVYVSRKCCKALKLKGFRRIWELDVSKIPTMKSLDSDKKASKSSDANVAEAADDNNGFFTANEKINFSNVKVEPFFEEERRAESYDKKG